MIIKENFINKKNNKEENYEDITYPVPLSITTGGLSVIVDELFLLNK